MNDTSTQGIKTVLHPVSDLERAKAVYTALLGVPPTTDDPFYVGYETAGQHIGLLPGGGPQAWPRRWPTGMCRMSRPS